MEGALLILETERSFRPDESEFKSIKDVPTLLMLRNLFERKLQSQIAAYVERGSMSKVEKDRITLQLFAQLRLIHVWPRYDGRARYSKEYPMIITEPNRYSYNEEWEIGELDFRQAISFNLEHELLVGLLQETFGEIDNLDTLDASDIIEAKKKRRAFLSGRKEFSTKRCK